MGTRLHAAVTAAIILVGSTATAMGPDPALDRDGSPSTYERIHLQSDSGDYLWWSLAPHEEAADRQFTTRTCPSQSGLPGAKPCQGGRSGTDRTSSLWFHPRSRVAAPVTWGPQAPLRFHFELDVDTPLPDVQVRLVHQGPAGLLASAPATEVEPGIWEGTLEDPGTFGADDYALFGVRLQSPGETVATMRLALDGASWVEFPEPVSGWSAGDLLAQSPLAEDPTRYETPLRTIWFADDDWEVVTLEGSLAQTGAVTHRIDRPAAAVLGWVEAFGSPAIHHAVREGEVEPARVTETPELRLLHDGVELETGGNPGTVSGGQGTDSLAVTDVAVGDLTLEVVPSDVDQTSPFTAYLLVIYGPRSLERMQVSFTPAHNVRQPAFRAVVAASCSARSEFLPLTSAATGVRIRVEWDSVALNTKWAPRFSLPGADFPCSEAGTGTEVTLVPVTPYVIGFGATPAYDATFVSYRDTMIHADVRILYQPEPVG